MLKSAAISYLVRHVFLPPNLPGKDDYNAEHETALLDVTIDALIHFEHCIVDGETDITPLLEAIRTLKKIRQESAPGAIDEGMLLSALDQLSRSADGVLSLHICAQNAGVVVNKVDHGHVHVEVFELSARNESVMATKGRLKRCFPAFAVSIEIDTFRQPEFQGALAQTLAAMSCQSAAGTKPKARKAGQLHDEDRDTTNPKLVTELLMAILGPNSHPVDVLVIGKNTREDVIWCNSLRPWRRSPLWLLVRVTLQLMLARLGAKTSPHANVYKAFMICFMAHVLDLSVAHSCSYDLTYSMVAKVNRRLLKLNKFESQAAKFALGAVKRASERLQSTWSVIIQEEARNPDLSVLKTLEFGQDLFHKLPEVDQYIQSATLWEGSTKTSTFQPECIVTQYSASELPTLPRIGSSWDRATYDLTALETWVRTNLAAWIARHVSQSCTSERIGRLIMDYHEVAQDRYSGDPEALSEMLLTILELWVACDRSTVSNCDLLHDYDPGLPQTLLQSLILPAHQQMQRLSDVENYVHDRRQRAFHASSAIFTQYGTMTCFAVTYFRHSPKHQNLLRSIEEKARRDRQDKCQELCTKQEKFRHLMAQHDSLQCEYDEILTDWENDVREFRHRNRCRKCGYQSQAQSLKIKVHEWPLPSNQLQAQNTVFELDIPVSFGHWRDTTLFVLIDVLHSEYASDLRPRSKYPLASYTELSSFSKAFYHAQRIGLLSQEKPHGVTHRHHKSIATINEADVCVNNGLRYQYYDEKLGTFMHEFITTENIPKELTYNLPSKSQSLQKYLFRPPSMPSGPPPNTVIANQGDCPDHISLEEYKALASIGLGFRIQWHNILVQLSAPSIDFRKVETTLTLFQSIYQAGPPSEHPSRVSHEIIRHTKFATQMLDRVADAHERIKGNWESSEALNLFINLTTRLLSLTIEDQLSDMALSLLATLRNTAFRWMALLREKSDTAIEATERTLIAAKAAEIALICVQSFNVDDMYLGQVISGTRDASTFVQCSIIIQDALLALSEDTSVMRNVLRRRWADSRIAYLDDALLAAWPAYRAGGRWRLVSDSKADWLVCRTTHQRGRSFVVHYSLLMGKLLVNGLPLARLPDEHERTSTYGILFGCCSLEVMPSPVPGMQFSAKKQYAGHEIHFGLDHVEGALGSVTQDLRLQTIRNAKTCLLIPSRLLRDHLPIHFWKSFVHWYDVSKGTIEFCPINEAWSSSTANWMAVKCLRSGHWKLMQNHTALVSMKSNTARRLHDVLSPLEDGPRIHVTFHPPLSAVKVDIPQLQIGFSLRQGESTLRSRQYREMIVDADQNVGALVGLRNQLVLRHDRHSTRLLIIPEGPVNFSKTLKHVNVSVDKTRMMRSHFYHIDSLLGRIVDNGSLRSKLVLSYFHALTSFCLPDPLTKMTGTEQALCILRSASVSSYDQFAQGDVDLLDQISCLAPVRKYYPANERVMQTVEWSPKLGFLAQHGSFYTVVKQHFEREKIARIFHPGTKPEIPDLNHMNVDLLERECIRSSTFRAARFGAENHTTKYDAEYSARDKGQRSTSTIRALGIATFLSRQEPSLPFHIPSNASKALWDFLAQAREILGPNHQVSRSAMKFDSTLLQDPLEWISKHLVSLHRELSQAMGSINRYSLMMWLSTMAFATSSDVLIVQVVAAFFVLPEMAHLTAPEANSFQLHLGATMNVQKIRDLVRSSAKAFNRCPESQGLNNRSSGRLRDDRHRQFQSNQNRAINGTASQLFLQWPCSNPHRPAVEDCATFEQHINLDQAMSKSRAFFKAVDDNRRFLIFLEEICCILARPHIEPVTAHNLLAMNPVWNASVNYRHVTVDDLFRCTAPSPLSDPPHSLDKLVSRQISVGVDTNSRLGVFLDRLEAEAKSKFEFRYIGDLRQSHKSLQRVPSPQLHLRTSSLQAVETYRAQCQQCVDKCYMQIIMALRDNRNHLQAQHKPDSSPPFTILEHFSRISPSFFLEQLSRTRWTKTPVDWRRSIVHYAVCLTKLQQADRLRSNTCNKPELLKEVENLGHTNWDPMDHPESLLFEVESSLIIREVQEQIADKMRSPPARANTMMQLNMGEGKSSVIVPIVAAALANTSRLVRVIVAKPQAKQMFRMLVSKLGGLLNRRIYHMPFSRDLKLNEAACLEIYRLCENCMINGGVLLVQPEHLLSFKLMGLECLITGKEQIGRSLMQTQAFFDTSARDIVDESDEVFSVKFELIYSMGTQKPMELCPDRWFYIQQVLDITQMAASQIHEQSTGSVEICKGRPGSFPRIRILSVDAQKQISRLIAERICAVGFHGFPIAHQAANTRLAVQKYILEPILDANDTAQVECVQPGSLWSDTVREVLLLLRGLLAGGVLTFAFSQKRWRVNYGLDPARKPAKRLAVPYRAKDSPSLRSEFSHPDVVIVLTSLSHYYGGLQDNDLFLSFNHLLRSDQADVEYQAWVQTAPDLPLCFRQLVGINLQDHSLCTTQVFPALRFAKGAVDYFLAHVVFPKEMREFPKKLTASGWDIGENRCHPTTGFSGTIDSRKLLPLNVMFLDQGEHKHTNALVLDYLLRPENCIALVPPRSNDFETDVGVFLRMFRDMRCVPRVILDVGAQVLDLDNLGVAQEWLRTTANHDEIQAVIFVDEQDEICVLDRTGRVEALQTSPFATQLGSCVVYLDEAHTRGTDLKLPDEYRAAVTLGPNVTKDRLIQACMRMRKLGKGQSVVFCVPNEIRSKIVACVHKTEEATIDVSDVLMWAISETAADLRRAMPLWAVQGTRFERQETFWNPRESDKRLIPITRAQKFLEDESVTLEHRYKPCNRSDASVAEQVNQTIRERCQEFQDLQWSSANLQEEQERELSPEMEQERQVQRPASATPAKHCLHPDLVKFVQTGRMAVTTTAYRFAFEALDDTSAATYFNVSHFPKELWVTSDFARTIQVSGPHHLLDAYQRSVQWILASADWNSNEGYVLARPVLAISPYEAQELMPLIETSQCVSLHLYAPRPNLGFRSLDKLDLYVVSSRSEPLPVPRRTIVLLNLFAGQLYLDSFEEYKELCALLGVVSRPAEQGQLITADGFMLPCNGTTRSEFGFLTSPVKFLKVHMTKVRKNSESIDKTHLGRLFAGTLLHHRDFVS